MIAERVFADLREASFGLAGLCTAQKNAALAKSAESIGDAQTEILAANKIDVEKARKEGIKDSLIDRLLLTEERLGAIVRSIQTVIAQPDPVGRVLEGWKTANGLNIKKVCVPMGVAAIIYESRPNVTAEAFSLAWKSGNALLLRGSSSALESNKALVNAIKKALPIPHALELACGGHEEVDQIIKARGKIDVVLPRGGKNLIETVCANAAVPVIETGTGVCHLFVDESADTAAALAVAENAKLQRPGVCNAIETLLVHKNLAECFLPALAERFAGRAELRCCERSFPILNAAVQNAALSSVRNTKLVPASDGDFGTEFLDYILAVKVVDSVEQAVAHINAHNSGHSESIITESIANARFFQTQVDAACVYVNASTRFTDGGEFGFGAEWGISTQKLHVRGPMGLSALTTTKYCIDGEGQVR